MNKLSSRRALRLALPLIAILASTALSIAHAAEPETTDSWTINMKDADIRDFIEQISSISK